MVKSGGKVGKPLKNLDNITWSNKRRVPIKRRVPDKRRGSRSFVLINAGGAYSRIYGNWFENVSFTYLIIKANNKFSIAV